MFEHREARRIRYLLGSYSAEWAREPWHSFSPLAVFHDSRLRQQVAKSFRELRSRHADEEHATLAEDDKEKAAEFVAFQFSCYLTIRRKWDRLDSAPWWIDVRHSGLLMWLLSGREPTPLPPPILGSYPCHSLAVGEPVRVQLEMFRGKGEPVARLMIDANADDFQWQDESSGLIVHTPTRHLYQLTGETLQRVSFQRKVC